MNYPLVSQEVSTSINNCIDSFFEQSIKSAAAIDKSYERLWRHLYSLIQSGGKRIRPQMTVMSYAAFGGNELESITPVAAAQELLHFSLLIHDDIIDRDYVRYGAANIAGRYHLDYSQFVSSREDLTHYAHSAAILGGDLILSGAHQLIASSQLSGEDIAMAQSILSTGIFEVAGGELLDTELSFMHYKSGDALKVATYKTAGYSFVAPLLTGAKLAGATNSQSDSLKALASSLGIAYQLTDDLLGVFGDEQKTGKSTVSDIIEGKRTYLIEATLESLTPADQATFMLTFGNPKATPLEIDVTKQLIEASGARQLTEQKVAEYTTQALDSLNSLELSSEHHDKFAQLISKVTRRVS